MPKGGTEKKESTNLWAIVGGAGGAVVIAIIGIITKISKGDGPICKMGDLNINCCKSQSG